VSYSYVISNFKLKILQDKVTSSKPAIQNRKFELEMKTENKKVRNQKKKGENVLPARSTAPIQGLAQPTTRTSPSQLTASGLRLPRDEAARWSSGRHPINRHLPDGRDEGRRPWSTIKTIPAARGTLGLHPFPSLPPVSAVDRNPSSGQAPRRRYRSSEASTSSPGAPPRRIGSPGGRNRRMVVSISGF
jgi:hypothetical protein